MVESSTRSREIGRPRTFSDEAIYVATAKVLARTGNEHLTLSLIAEEVGCSPPALVQRFGSKQSLLKSYITWNTEVRRQRFADAASMDISPVQKIYRLAVESEPKRPGEITEYEGIPTAIFIYLAAWNDESFRPLVKERVELLETELQKLVEQAIAADEIRGCDPTEMAKTLATVLAGVALQAISLDREPVGEWTAQIIKGLLRPYLVTP
ncbi:MAG: TetR/AcrR family transcriptional regulator [Thermomicrobiales bacterium]|jgi:AcrR family transcriptional regulator|nr:TetR/AcrR family transcriptional regulator [Thermomicrobiales bacterium]